MDIYHHLWPRATCRCVTWMTQKMESKKIQGLPVAECCTWPQSQSLTIAFHNCLLSLAVSSYLSQLWLPWIIFLPTSRKVLPAFQIFSPGGVHFAQTAVHFAHFQVQAKKLGVLGWGLGYFECVHIPKRGLWQLNKQQGVVVVFWARWDPIWAKWDPSGQFVRNLKVGKSALELGKKKFNDLIAASASEHPKRRWSCLWVRL